MANIRARRILKFVGFKTCVPDLQVRPSSSPTRFCKSNVAHVLCLFSGSYKHIETLSQAHIWMVLHMIGRWRRATVNDLCCFWPGHCRCNVHCLGQNYRM